MKHANSIIIVRGGGDLATGVIQKFHRSGFDTLVLETATPAAIRRTVALCEAVYEKESTVEDISCRRIESLAELESCFNNRVVPILIDPDAKSIAQLRPIAVIDAILAKRNLGTDMSMAPITVALGPGFCAGEDVHAVIETMRGHDLGRLIFHGRAQPNTGIPGEISGESMKRVIHAPVSGFIKHIKKIGDIVEAGQTIFEISSISVTAPFKGLLRGLIREGFNVREGMKVADIDPRLDVNCHTISDKARCLGGATLEAFLHLKMMNEEGL